MRKVEKAALRSEVLGDVKEVLTLSHRAAHWLYGELRWFCRVVLSAGERFYWDNGFSRAASLAYITLLSFVPFFTLGFGILAAFAVSEKYVANIEAFIIRRFVPAPDVAQQIIEFMEQISVQISAVGVPMIVFFVVTSIVLINSIEGALNETWQVFEPRPLGQKLGIFCAIILIVPIFILSVYLFVDLRIRQFFGEGGRHLDTVFNHLVPFVIAFSAFVFLYYLVPKAPVKFKSAVPYDDLPYGWG